MLQSLAIYSCWLYLGNLAHTSVIIATAWQEGRQRLVRPSRSPASTSRRRWLRTMWAPAPNRHGFLSQHHHGPAVELWRSDCECAMVVTCLYFHPGSPDWIPSSVPCLAMYALSNCLTSPCLNFLSLQNRADNHRLPYGVVQRRN